MGLKWLLNTVSALHVISFHQVSWFCAKAFNFSWGFIFNKTSLLKICVTFSFLWRVKCHLRLLDPTIIYRCAPLCRQLLIFSALLFLQLISSLLPSFRGSRNPMCMLIDCASWWFAWLMAIYKDCARNYPHVQKWSTLPDLNEDFPGPAEWMWDGTLTASKTRLQLRNCHQELPFWFWFVLLISPPEP